MPRTRLHGAAFVLGFWLAIELLLPIMARGEAPPEGELVRLESELHAAVNHFRASQHLIPLERDPRLDAVARGHSRDMATRRFFSHESPEGRDWVDRLQAAGIEGFSMAAENVGQTSRSLPNREILEGWKHSPAHRQNLAARPFNRTGLGIARASDGTLFYTQLYLAFPR